jgi:hypothetical protein
MYPYLASHHCAKCQPMDSRSHVVPKLADLNPKCSGDREKRTRTDIVIYKLQCYQHL